MGEPIYTTTAVHGRFARTGWEVWKYQLLATDLQDVPMPCGAELLAVQVQGAEPYVWALVNTKRTLTKRRFAVHGTGHSTFVGCDHACYVGTFQLHDGSLVFHVFDLGEVE